MRLILLRSQLHLFVEVVGVKMKQAGLKYKVADRRVQSLTIHAIRNNARLNKYCDTQVNTQGYTCNRSKKCSVELSQNAKIVSPDGLTDHTIEKV